MKIMTVISCAMLISLVISYAQVFNDLVYIENLKSFLDKNEYFSWYHATDFSTISWNGLKHELLELAALFSSSLELSKIQRQHLLTFADGINKLFDHHCI